MKILREIGRDVVKKINALTGEGFEVDVEKRKGLYVARPVLNGDSWVKWAEKFGVPNPVPAGEIHVSILNSVVDVKIPPLTEPVSIETSNAAFVALGLALEDSA